MWAVWQLGRGCVWHVGWCAWALLVGSSVVLLSQLLAVRGRRGSCCEPGQPAAAAALVGPAVNGPRCKQCGPLPLPTPQGCLPGSRCAALQGVGAREAGPVGGRPLQVAGAAAAGRHAPHRIQRLRHGAERALPARGLREVGELGSVLVVVVGGWLGLGWGGGGVCVYVCACGGGVGGWGDGVACCCVYCSHRHAACAAAKLKAALGRNEHWAPAATEQCNQCTMCNQWPPFLWCPAYLCMSFIHLWCPVQV